MTTPAVGDPALSTLDSHVERLLAFCVRVGAPPPPWRACLVLETRHPRVKYQSGPVHGWALPAEALCPVSRFEERFRSLLTAGYSWINLSAYGLFRGDLIIGVELPNEPGGVPPGRTSVNYSGPALDPTGKPSWALHLWLTA